MNKIILFYKLFHINLQSNNKLKFNYQTYIYMCKNIQKYEKSNLKFV